MQRINAEKALSSVASASEQNSNRSSDLLRANRLWDRMQEIFGSSWVNQYGTTPNRTWVDALSRLTDEQIICGLRRTVGEGNEFPPNLAVFVSRCQHDVQNNPRETPHYKLLPLDPPETEQQIADRKARGREHMQAVREALRGAQ